MVSSWLPAAPSPSYNYSITHICKDSQLWFSIINSYSKPLVELQFGFDPSLIKMQSFFFSVKYIHIVLIALGFTLATGT